MILNKPLPVESIDNLRGRIVRLLRKPVKTSSKTDQLSLDLSATNHDEEINHPNKNIFEFLNFITDAVPDGDVYLFGGVIRDLALSGRRGFNSDIDLVVEGNWSGFISYLDSLNAYKNKFGGYRLFVDGWPVDIWSAKETWAIKQGYIEYKGVSSLLDTTVLNWDAILMNWRTKMFLHKPNYFEELNERYIDIVLEENPNPLGMLVRVFRHIIYKDAKILSDRVVRYLHRSSQIYSYDVVSDSENVSYGDRVITKEFYMLFYDRVINKNESNIEFFQKNNLI